MNQSDRQGTRVAWFKSGPLEEYSVVLFMILSISVVHPDHRARNGRHFMDVHPYLRVINSLFYFT